MFIYIVFIVFMRKGHLMGEYKCGFCCGKKKRTEIEIYFLKEKHPDKIFCENCGEEKCPRCNHRISLHCGDMFNPMARECRCAVGDGAFECGCKYYEYDVEEVFNFNPIALGEIY